MVQNVGGGDPRKIQPGLPFHQAPSDQPVIGNHVARVHLLHPLRLALGLASREKMALRAPASAAAAGEFGMIGGLGGDLGESTGRGRRIEPVDEPPLGIWIPGGWEDAV